MKLDRAGIAQRVPHAGAMCLLDAVTDWTPEWIECRSRPVGPDHPLARAGRVPAIAATEYAAQATAVHGALLAREGKARAGRLAALTDVLLCADVVPPASVAVRADLLGRSGGGCLYRFEVSAGGTTIASGRLMVVLLAEADQ